MKTTYLKCHHGNELRIGCNECENEKSSIYNGFIQKAQGKPTKIPIYRGCNNTQGCFCSGKCKEIIGYREP